MTVFGTEAAGRKWLTLQRPPSPPVPPHLCTRLGVCHPPDGARVARTVDPKERSNGLGQCRTRPEFTPTLVQSISVIGRPRHQSGLEGAGGQQEEE